MMSSGALTTYYNPLMLYSFTVCDTGLSVSSRQHRLEGGKCLYPFPDVEYIYIWELVKEKFVEICLITDSHGVI